MTNEERSSSCEDKHYASKITIISNTHKINDKKAAKKQ